MQPTSGIKKLLPNALAILAFLVISALFCTPALKGNRIAPHDSISWRYMTQEAREYYEATGQAPNWSNSMFGGGPTMLIYQPSQTNWMGNLLAKIQMQPDNGTINPIIYFFIAMISFYALLKALRLNTLLSAVGAITFAFSSYHAIILAAGHITKLLDIALMPGVIAGIILIYRGRYLLGTLCFALFMAFFINAAHIQIIYYGMITCAGIGMAFLVSAIRNGKLSSFLKGSALIVGIAAVAGITAFSGLKGIAEYSKHSIRGGKSELTINKSQATEQTDGGLSKDYAFQWSNGIGETFCILIPNLYGGQSGEHIGADSKFGTALTELGVPEYQVEQMTARAPTYWGPQPFLSGPIYFGAIVCFLFVLALFTIKHPLKWWLTALAFLFIALSWGKHFAALNYFLFDHLPFYNKFRTPSMALSITGIIFPLLGFWGVYAFMSDRYSPEQRVALIKKAALITGGLTVLIILYSQTMMSFKGDNDAEMAKAYGEHSSKLLSALRADRQSMALKDGLRSLALILIAAAALWAYATEKLQQKVAIAVLGLASLIDLWGVGHRYIKEDIYIDEDTLNMAYYTPRPVDSEILKDKDPDFRVLDLSINTFNDAKSSYFYNTIGGYHPAKLQIYQDLIETQINKLNSSVLNMLNTKYIIGQGKQAGAEQLMPNPNALGHAWFVSDIHYTQTADETILSMNAPALTEPADTTGKAFNPATTAVIRDQYRQDIGTEHFTTDSGSSIVLTQYGLPELQYASDNTHDGFAVFSEIYYPLNWKAYIDGQETPIYCVNYVLRGIKVPAGKHQITFKYEDLAFKRGERINLAANAAISLILVASIVLLFIKKKKDGSPEGSQEPEELI